MRRLLLISASLMLMAGAASAQTSAAAGSTYPYDKAPWWMNAPVITQTGSVFTEIPANRANFSATFMNTDDKLDKAQAAATDRTRALQQALAKLGKDAVRVTTSFNVRALYEQYKDKNGNRIEDQRGDKINGYSVTLSLSVEIRDMAQLEKAYALVLAAQPTNASDINFSLQPTNETNTWLYSKAIEDAHTRAVQSAAAAGAKLGPVKVIDPTGRACETDILARAPDAGWNNTSAQEVDYYDKSYAMAMPVAAPAPPPPPPPPMGTAEYLEYMAMKNPFIQTPPLQRLNQTACVVYGLN